MMSTVQKWGNSLALRIPASIAGQLEIIEGSPVVLELRDRELVVRRADAGPMSLKELLKDCRPSQLHHETDFGDDVGREVIE
jgi:antitoxin MazE